MASLSTKANTWLVIKDAAIPLSERMKLADGKPLPRRLMAAMGQQDRGQCGYNCQDYADALFAKSEKRLNLCVPGGKETARMLRELYQELDGAPAVVAPTLEAKPVLGSRPGRPRDNPVYATFLSRRRLNKPRLGEGNLAHRSRGAAGLLTPVTRTTEAPLREGRLRRPDGAT